MSEGEPKGSFFHPEEDKPVKGIGGRLVTGLLTQLKVDVPFWQLQITSIQAAVEAYHKRFTEG